MSGSRAVNAGSLVVVAACVLAGCGGSHHDRGRPGPSRRSSSSAAAVRVTMRHALADLAAGRGAAFCALLDRDTRSGLSRRVHAPCRRVVTLVATRLSAPQRAALRHLRIGEVSVSGAGRASATARCRRRAAACRASSAPARAPPSSPATRPARGGSRAESRARR